METCDPLEPAKIVRDHRKRFTKGLPKVDRFRSKNVFSGNHVNLGAYGHLKNKEIPLKEHMRKLAKTRPGWRVSGRRIGLRLEVWIDTTDYLSQPHGL
ncbi:MAG: hypothetical protein LC676_08835 [Loktanella sp.]|nr:hypothetical protein [Loktanella sp.]